MIKNVDNQNERTTKIRKNKNRNRYVIHYPVNNSSINGSSVEDDNDLDTIDGPNSNNSLFDGLYKENITGNGHHFSAPSMRRHVTRRQIHVNYNKTQFNRVMLKSFRLE